MKNFSPGKKILLFLSLIFFWLGIGFFIVSYYSINTSLTNSLQNDSKSQLNIYKNFFNNFISNNMDVLSNLASNGELVEAVMQENVNFSYLIDKLDGERHIGDKASYYIIDFENNAILKSNNLFDFTKKKRVLWVNRIIDGEVDNYYELINLENKEYVLYAVPIFYRKNVEGILVVILNSNFYKIFSDLNGQELKGINLYNSKGLFQSFGKYEKSKNSIQFSLKEEVGDEKIIIEYWLNKEIITTTTKDLMYSIFGVMAAIFIVSLIIFRKFAKEYIVKPQKELEKEANNRKKYSTKLEMALKASKMGMWEMDLDTNEIEWDSQMYRVFDVNRVDFNNKYDDFKKLIHPEDVQILEKELTASLSEIRDSSYEFRIIDSDGEVRFLAGIGTCLLNEDEQITKLVGLNWDVSDEKKDEQTIMDAYQNVVLEKERVTKAEKIKSEFLANMSHEIRTPLNGLMGMISLLEDNLRKEENIKTTNIIMRSCESLLTVINDILDFSKIEAGKIEIEKAEVNLYETLENCHALYNSLASKKGITLITNITKEVPRYIIGDSVRIQQILNNLISNSIKFSEGGKVILSIEVENQIDNTDYDLLFKVIDQGIGISQKNIEKLFKHFSQVDESTTRRFGGTGLGLAISKELAVLMDGDINVESVIGEGSTFVFNLEAKAISVDVVESRIAIPKIYKKIESLNVLVVEDNKVNQMVTSGMLKKFDCSFDIANDGIEALEMIEKTKYDLIFMDCHMPRLDGFETTIELVKRYGENKPLIVALTASVMKQDVDRCYEVGMDDFTSKPVTKEHIYAILVKYFG